MSIPLATTKDPFIYYCSSLQADASNEEDSAADQTAASEEGAESPVAGRRHGLLLAAHCLDRRSPRHADAESPPNVEELRGVPNIATAAHYAGQPAESADGDDAQLADGAPAVLPDEAALASAADQPAAEHVRDVLDTPTALASGTARQDLESLDSDRTGARPQDGGRGMRGNSDSGHIGYL